MTTILYCDGKLYADSAVYKGNDRFVTLNKINAFPRPTRIKCDVGFYTFDDIVYGWAGTGSQSAMAAFTRSLIKIDEGGDELKDMTSRTLMAAYRLAYDLDLITDENTFGILLLGKEFNHQFVFNRMGFDYTQMALDRNLALGSGNDLVKKFYLHHRDPIRAMLETFWLEELSGGPIDIWELSRGDIIRFERIGLFEEIERTEIPKFLESYKPGVDQVFPEIVRASRFYNSLLKTAKEELETPAQRRTRLKKEDQEIKSSLARAGIALHPVAKKTAGTRAKRVTVLSSPRKKK